MKRWTNGLPGATERLGANLALGGLSGRAQGSRMAVSLQPEIAYSAASVSARSTTAFVAARSTRHPRVGGHGARTNISIEPTAVVH
jgi:hypothetical protein